MKNKLFYVFKEKIKLKYILFNYIYNWSGTKKKKIPNTILLWQDWACLKKDRSHYPYYLARIIVINYYINENINVRG